MKYLILIFFLHLFLFGFTQNQNTEITIINQNLKFDSGKIIIDSSTFLINLRHDDTMILNTFNHDTSEISILKIILFKKRKKDEFDLKNLNNK